MTLSTAPALTADEERDLIAAAQQGDQDAQAALVASQVRYLRAEARRYGSNSHGDIYDAEDLVQVGVLALLHAVQSFDPSRGARLWTHAHRSIAEAMAEEVASAAGISVPGRTLRRYRKAVRDTETVEEARALAQSRDGMDPATFDAIRHALTGGSSLDVSWETSDRTSSHGYGGDSVASTMTGSHGETITSEANLLGSRGPSPEGTAISRTLAQQALASLTDTRQRAVIALAFFSGEDLSDAQIAARLDVSRPTVTRLRNSALDLMRTALEA